MKDDELRKVSLLLEDYFKQKKQIYIYCPLGVDMGVYGWSASLPSKQFDLFENRAQKHTQILASVIRRLEHWNKAEKLFHSTDA